MNRRADGFTLIELLVAIAVFSILALVAYGGLQSLLLGRDDVEREMQQLAELQMVFLNLQRDLEQTVNRPLRSAYGEELAAFAVSAEAGRAQIELTRAGWRNPMSRARSHLLRVAYELQGGRLQRSYWNVLDRAQDSKPVSRVLMANIRAMTLRFLAADDEWHDDWAGPVEADEATLPRAIEVTLEIDNWGEVRRVFSLTG